MGIHETKTPKHWNYFLALEDDVVRLSRYVELTDDNFKCYSLELARILFAAASEVDVVAKQLCQKLDKSSKANDIVAYRKKIKASYPQIIDAGASVPKFGLALNPWEQWGKDKSPLWWLAYNSVKHRRHTHFAEANLKHALNAVAGLFILLLFFYRNEGQDGQLGPDPSVFRAGAPFVVDHLFDAPHLTVYQLPNPQ